MDALTATIPVGNQGMAVQTAWPQGTGRFPALVVIMHAGGVDTFVHGMLQKLVDAGYFVAAPDLYHRLDSRQGSGLDRMKLLRDPQVESDVNATVDFLCGHPLVEKTRLGIMGFCMGGRVAYLMAARNHRFRAAVAFYGGNIMIPWGEEGPTPFDLTADLGCPLQFHFGDDDTNPSPADRQKLDAALTKHGKLHEFHRYAGAAHAFLNFTNPDRYREAASHAAWPRTLDFLTRQLG
ncbi:MAG: hypothetical protein GC149_02720 [Gammaproteobacteria bacterium]|nr:hypothetical protein [Gammaproteobacteria bacterium]